MIRLAARVTLGGGVESAVRLVLTAIGVAVGVCLLLFTAVAFPALHAHDARAGWTTTSEHNVRPGQDESKTDPLLWRVTKDRFDGHDITRVDVAAVGPRAPVPGWLAHLPGAGEIAASPHMAELLRTTDPALLGDRFSGRVTETVGADALQSSDQLVVVVGHTPTELRALGAQSVRSIETAPLAHNFSDFLRVVLVVGALGLLVPVLVFVSTATRLGAARREQRLAAMRLAGATPRQADTVAAVEAALAAIVGALLGFVVFFVVRPSAARVPFDGHSFYVADLHLALGWAVLIAFGVPALAVAAALISLRRVRVSPLGVTRQTSAKRPTARRLVLLAAALAFFVITLAVFSHGHSNDGAVFAIGLAFALIVVGIAVSGPWLTTVVARGMARGGRRAPSLLAARRLQHNPSAGFRAISGLVLAVFVASLVSALAASATASAPFTRSPISATSVGAVVSNQKAVPADQENFPPPDDEAPAGLGVDAASRLLHDLRAIPGVQRVVDFRALPAEAGVPIAASLEGNTHIVSVFPGGALMRCTDAAAFGLPACTGTTGIDPNIQFGNGSLQELRRPVTVSPAEFAGRPLVGVVVFTNGNSDTIERARTRLEVALPGTAAITGSDFSADQNWQVHNIAQMSNVALLLTLLIAGCSLSVSVAGGLVERKRPFALLRLAGMPLRQLHRVVLAEAAAPLLVVAAVSAALGFAVDAILLAAIGNDTTFRLPTIGYWAALAGGLAFALVVVGATLPLLDRLTSLETARFE